jgi:alpha/beta superfamily hydrolase
LRRIESLFVAGPAGRIEALLEEPEDREPVLAALVCHPHPQHGGTMHNKVVYRMARGSRKAGAVVLRFNYRGVNLSEGAYDNGVGEVDDAAAALALLRARYPALPFVLEGFSFGSRIVQKLGCGGGAARIVAVGFPVSHLDGTKYTRCGVARTFIHSTNDEFGPREEFERFYDSLEGANDLRWVEARDHFFGGALDEFEAAVEATLSYNPSQSA